MYYESRLNLKSCGENTLMAIELDGDCYLAPNCVSLSGREGLLHKRQLRGTRLSNSDLQLFICTPYTTRPLNRIPAPKRDVQIGVFYRVGL